MKILFFCPIPPPFHGSNYIANLLINGLKENNKFKIKHINSQFSYDIKSLQKFTFKKTYLFFKYLFKLIITSISYKPDFIIMIPAFAKNPFIVSFIYVFIAKVILKNKVVLWIHSNNIKTLYDNSNFVVKKAITNIFRYSYIIVPCAKKLIENNYQFFSSKNKIKPIHNGIPINILKNSKSEEIHVSYLSNMHITKGWKFLFDAAEIICKKYNNIKFCFYGNPTNNSPEEFILKIFNSSKFFERIKYFGPVYGEEKLKVLMRTDIFCFPSDTEAFPLAILESMAYGLPVITTNQGGITEAIVDGKGGFIVEKQNVSELAEKLEILINNPELRKEMGEFNRKRYLEYFKYEKFLENWEKLLLSLN